MSEERFAWLLPRLRPYTDYLYFHILGEPLCHPKLGRFLELAQAQGFKKVILTTNGTLLKQKQELLLASPASCIRSTSLSMPSKPTICPFPSEDYLRDCFRFGQMAEGNKTVVYRLWNEGGQNEMNQKILETAPRGFPGEMDSRTPGHCRWGPYLFGAR